MRSCFIAGFTFVAFAAMSALSVAGCGDNEAEPPRPPGPTADGGSSGSSGGTDGSSDGSSGPRGSSTCSALAQEGASVDIKGAKPPIPEAKGGTPVDGTYVLTGVKAFTDLLPEGETFRKFGSYTLVIAASGKSFEQIVINDKDETTRAKGDLTLDGVDFTATPSCEDPLKEAGVTILKGKFTADPTAMKMYVVRELGITAELTFEKK
jgi:hypothetical protein